MNPDEIRVLKTGSCPSLSGRSTLTYIIGCNSQRAIYLRLSENTGAGVFSKDWMPLAQLDPLLASDDKPITAKMVRSLFVGKSVNTSTFVIAALIAEGLLKVSNESLRTYERTDPTVFKKSILVLIDSINAPSIEEKPVKGKKTTTNQPANPIGVT